MEENKTIGLNDLMENQSTEEVAQTPDKELSMSQQSIEAYKAKKIAENKAMEEEFKAKQEEQAKKEHEEHMQRVYNGDDQVNNTSEFFDSLLHDVDNAMARKKKEKEIIDAHYEKQAEELEEEQEVQEMLEGNYEDETSDVIYEEPELEIGETPQRSLQEILDEIDDDEEDDDDEEESKDEDDGIEKLVLNEEEWMERLKKSATEKIKIIKDDKVINLSEFSIATKAVSVKNAIKVVNTDSSPYKSNWALFNTGIPITMEEFKGQEIAKLLGNEDLTRYNRNREIYKLIYDHDLTENKPTFTEWLKEISIRDNDHLYMSIYRSSFGNANYIPYNCNHCGEVFVSDEIPLYKLIKYKTKEDEIKAEEILNKALREPTKMEKILEQISDDYVMEFKDPSLHNIYIESALLPEDFARANTELITYISYINAIYVIDRATKTLVPINLTKNDNDMKKELMIKIKRYSKILKELSPDELNKVQSIIANIVSKKEVEIDYILPEQVCPRCGKIIKESPVTAQDLVFTRHQLAHIMTM